MQASTSVGVAQPGMTGTRCAMHQCTTSGFVPGLIIADLHTANGFLRRVCAECHLRRGQPAFFQHQRQRHCFFRIVDLNNRDDPDRF